MISDVLLDALDEIEKYQREMPDIYGASWGEIERLKLEMRILIRSFNDPKPLEKAKALKEEITSMIRKEIAAAIQKEEA